jgi:alpha-galactosidase
LDTISKEDLAILKNWEFLAFNQDDVWGAPALPYKWGINPAWTWNQTHPAEYYSGGSKRGIHVFMINTLNETITKSAIISEIPGLNPKKRYAVSDMWTHKKLGGFNKKVDVKLKAHDTAALLFVEKDGSHPCPDPAKLPKPEIYKTKPKRWLSAGDF